MARNDPVRYVSTFRAPSEYERQLEEARRRAMLAEALAQQQYEPQEGVVAPIPRAAPLVKALQGYMTARASKKAKEAEEAAEKAGRREAVDYIRSFEPEQRNVDMGQLAAMEAPTPMIEDGRISYAPPSAVAAPNQRLMPAMGAGGQPDFSQPMQMQVGGPLTEAQKRARALEGLESTNPMVRAYAADLMKPPEAEEFYAPIETAAGLVQFGKRGGKRETGYAAPAKSATGSSLSKLIAERDALPPDSPLRATYDAAIEKETTKQPPIALNLGEKGDVEAQKIFLKDLGELRPKAYAARNIIRAVNNLDRLTEEGTYTGALAPTAVGASQFLNSIGIKIDPKVLENTEAFAAQSSDLVLSAQAALGGARGFTKEETAILMQMFPQVINSPQARITIGNIIRNKQLDVIDEYDSLITDYESTYKDSKIPYKKMDDEEVRYQRWKRAQRNR